VLSAIFRVQMEREALDLNPCMMVDRLPENQRDAYQSWEDFQRLFQHSWWIRDLRHTWKTNAQRSGMDPTVRDLIVGPSTEAQERTAKSGFQMGNP
jgi:hypothetical protein